MADIEITTLTRGSRYVARCQPTPSGWRIEVKRDGQFFADASWRRGRLTIDRRTSDPLPADGAAIVALERDIANAIGRK